MVDAKKILEEVSKRTINENDDLLDTNVFDSLTLILFLSRLEEEGINISIARLDKNILRHIDDIQNYINNIENEDK